MLATFFVIYPKNKKQKKQKNKKTKNKNKEVDMYKMQVAYFIKTLILLYLNKLIITNKLQFLFKKFFLYK